MKTKIESKKLSMAENVFTMIPKIINQTPVLPKPPAPRSVSEIDSH